MKSAKEILTSHEKFHITLGHSRIKEILSLLGNPEKKYKIIHVAGTNGKGSTSKIINEILVQHFKNSDTKIGLFTSPHLFSYTERIKVNNEDISEYVFNKLTNDINELAIKNKIELSEFELITAVMFYYFYVKQVDYAILEVGLGGLYDSTNVINPIVSVITSIDFDHTQRLGNTIDEIAYQKAGIIKENSNVAFLKSNKGYSVLKKVANEKKSNIISLPKTDVIFKDGKSVALINDKEYEFNLFGEHQKENLALALGAISVLNLDIKDKTYKTALKNVNWRFRLEYHKKQNVLIDGGHNPSGITTLRNFLDDNFKDENKTFIFGCLKNKDYNKMLEILLKEEDEFYFYEFNYPNALKFVELPSEVKKRATKLNNIKELKEIIKNKKNLKIFTGSLYMLGQVFSEIKL